MSTRPAAYSQGRGKRRRLQSRCLRFSCCRHLSAVGSRLGHRSTRQSIQSPKPLRHSPAHSNQSLDDPPTRSFLHTCDEHKQSQPTQYATQLGTAQRNNAGEEPIASNTPPHPSLQSGSKVMPVTSGPAGRVEDVAWHWLAKEPRSGRLVSTKWPHRE